MANLEAFHFIRPYGLWLFVPVFYFAWKMKITSEKSSWHAVFDPALLVPHLFAKQAKRSLFWRYIGLLGACLAVLALSGPTWKTIPMPLFEVLEGRVILLDLSQSMLAQDVKPDRLTRAKQKIHDILALDPAAQVALVGFAAQPFVITPLTTDTKTIAALLPVLTPEIMPQQGSNIVEAIKLADELLQQAGIIAGQILLITDGIEEGDFKEASSLDYGELHQLAILGVGTEMGAPIPKPEGGFYSKNGQLVLSTLARAKLQQLATSGAYHDLTVNDDDIHFLLHGLPSNQSKETQSMKGMQWQDMGPWIVILLIPIVALAFRRGVFFIVVLSILPLSDNIAASLWLRPDQAAYETSLKGMKAYQDKDFKTAERYFSENKDAIADYNLGNALARQGRYEEAVQAYDEALKQIPKLEDAIYNRDIVRKLLQDQSKPDSSKQDNQEPKNNEQSQEQHQDKEKQSKAQQEQNQEQEQDQKEDQSHEKERDSATEPKSDKGENETSEPQSEAEAPDNIPSELKRVPDDPGGLLRRKFLYQYRKMYSNQSQVSEPW